MLSILRIVRIYVGGKTEIGLILFVSATAVYLLPIFPAFGWDQYMAFLVLLGAVTGTAFASRVEDKEGIFNALKSLFAAFRKKK